jgi:hypothetical protein
MIGAMKMSRLTQKKGIGPEPDDVRSLQKRYLFWLYKTTKDELDRIDRKFTQLDIDREMLDVFRRRAVDARDTVKGGVDAFVREWQEYVAGKEADARKLRFDEDGHIMASYYFLHLKLKTVLRIVRRRFGARTVGDFKRLYEEASMRLIVQDTSGKR